MALMPLIPLKIQAVCPPSVVIKQIPPMAWSTKYRFPDSQSKAISDKNKMVIVNSE